MLMGSTLGSGLFWMLDILQANVRVSNVCFASYMDGEMQQIARVTQGPPKALRRRLQESRFVYLSPYKFDFRLFKFTS